jgi:uncharacterized protein (DUF1697 family)
VALFVALLRSVNVGGTGKLSMAELTSLCVKLGFRGVRTYIQSGNVVLESNDQATAILDKLEKALTKKMSKEIKVVVRGAEEVRAVLAQNPFPGEDPAKVAVVFFAASLPPDLLRDLPMPGGEQLVQADREIYVYYPTGMGQSKLKLPKVCSSGTARNIRTVGRLVEMLNSGE